jgi:three-Cys-motif partner protein
MQFGGEWTQEKLQILERYLNAYTTALKNTSFSLVYIDAFAGAGQIDLQEDRDAVGFLRGSTVRAIQIRDKPFDELVFIEKDPSRCAHLERLRDEHPARKIVVENSEANGFLRDLRNDWRTWRGVLFLDPFATEVEWSTIKAIASFRALDTWILFPVSAVARMLPRSRRPDDISPKWASRLTSVFGDQGWRQLYRESPQGELFGHPGSMRDSGVDGLVGIYKENLQRLFGARFLSKSKRLTNSTGSPLFEFMFCVGNPKGIRPATRIAGHILDRM